MSPHKIPRGTASAAPRAVGDRADAESLSAVSNRLAEAEYQLEVQFTRIAQLQAQLDFVLAALRRVTEGPHKR
jgi:hypothetical protein